MLLLSDFYSAEIRSSNVCSGIRHLKRICGVVKDEVSFSTDVGICGVQSDLDKRAPQRDRLSDPDPKGFALSLVPWYIGQDRNGCGSGLKGQYAGQRCLPAVLPLIRLRRRSVHICFFACRWQNESSAIANALRGERLGGRCQKV